MHVNALMHFECNLECQLGALECVGWVGGWVDEVTVSLLRCSTVGQFGTGNVKCPKRTRPQE